jgi:hypothetical protein
MFRTIVVGYDGAERGGEAIALAEVLRDPRHGSLLLTSASLPTPVPSRATDLHSAKVRRVRRNPHVLVASCRADGKLRSDPLPARVELLTATAELERVQKLLIGRYKSSYRLVMLIYRLGCRLRGRRSLADGAAQSITVE